MISAASTCDADTTLPASGNGMSSRRSITIRRAVQSERAGGLAGVPLDGVQPVAAVGDVGNAEALSARRQVIQAHRQ